MLAIRTIYSPTISIDRRMLLIAGAVIAVALMLTFRDQVNVDAGTILAFGYLAVFILPMICSMTFLLPLPVIPLIILAGGLLDPVTTGLVAAAGFTAGMALSYFAAASGKDAVRSSIANRTGFTGRWTKKILGGFERRPVLTSFVISAIPSPAFAFSGMVAGAAGVRARTYFTYTFLGRIFTTLPLAFAGKYAAETVQSLGWITI